MFEQVFKNIDDILWKEAGCSTELDYTEQTSWLLFLKYLDDLEQERAEGAELTLPSSSSFKKPSPIPTSLGASTPPRWTKPPATSPSKTQPRRGSRTARTRGHSCRDCLLGGRKRRSIAERRGSSKIRSRIQLVSASIWYRCFWVSCVQSLIGPSHAGRLERP